MEIGSKVITLVDKNEMEGLKSIYIPKGTMGLVCETHEEFAIIEIWGDDAPKGVSGVFFYSYNELEERR